MGRMQIYKAVATALCATAFAASALVDRALGPEPEPLPPPARPGRIVSMMPSLTEITFALGAGDRVVGVTDYCVNPPEARTRVRLGGHFNPNLEALYALEPDLVLVTREESKIRSFCRKMRIPVLVADHHSIRQTFRTIRLLGMRLNQQERASALVERIRRELDQVRRDAAARRPVRVLISLGHTPGEIKDLWAVGPGGFVDELVGLAGGRNVLAGAGKPYLQVDVETVLAADPEVIIASLPGEQISPETREAELMAWSRLGSITAVRTHRIYLMASERITVAGPRMGKSAQKLSRIFAETAAGRKVGE